MHFFFFNDTATTEIYTLSLHDALPISQPGVGRPQALAHQGRADTPRWRGVRYQVAARELHRSQRAPGRRLPAAQDQHGAELEPLSAPAEPALSRACERRRP